MSTFFFPDFGNLQLVDHKGYSTKNAEHLTFLGLDKFIHWEYKKKISSFERKKFGNGQVEKKQQ